MKMYMTQVPCHSKTDALRREPVQAFDLSTECIHLFSHFKIPNVLLFPHPIPAVCAAHGCHLSSPQLFF